MTKKTLPHKKTVVANHFRGLTPEERVNTAIEMTDAVGTIASESIRDKYQESLRGRYCKPLLGGFS